MLVKKWVSLLIMVVLLLSPLVLHAGELKAADALTDIRNVAVREFLRANSGVDKNDVKAYASKLLNDRADKNGGLYLVEIAEEKASGNNVEIKRVSAYKVEVKSNKKSVSQASMEDVLYSLEMKHRVCSVSNEKTSKQETLDAYNEFCRASCRAFSLIAAEGVSKAYTTSGNLNKYVKYVKVKTAPASHAFYTLTVSLEQKIKQDLLSADLKADALESMKESLGRLGELKSSLNAVALSAEAPAEKHYDPTHPGHLHQAPNGTLYNQPGDNGPYSHGSSYPSYNSNNHHNNGHYNGHHYPSSNYPSYPPPTYYPPQYPQYPPPTYYPPQYPQPNYYPSYPNQIEHIHYCSRCGRQFSYYPNGYSIVCPYCGHVGY